MTKDPLKRLVYHLEAIVTISDKELVSFTADLTKDPVYALEWGGKAFRAAAQRHVAAQVLIWIEAMERKKRDDVMSHIVSAVNHQLLLTAQNVESSTSVCSNHLKDHVRAAWAQLAERLSDI